MKDPEKMSQEELEEEYESTKSFAEILVDRDNRRLDVNQEILRRLSKQL